MHHACVAIVFELAACWTTTNQPPRKDPVHPSSNPIAEPELRATVRIDATPGGKKAQPVWLEFGADKRWLIDYRPRELWRGFEDAEVIVTGHCYRPFGQALAATHYKVERMRFASPPKRSVPILEIGPEVVIKGSFGVDAAPAGSKLAGSSQLEFHADAGTTYAIAGSSAAAQLGPATIKARGVEINRAFAATTGGPHVWILSIHDLDYVPDSKDTSEPCP